MKNATQAAPIELGGAGLAFVGGTGVPVGEILLRTFLWSWSIAEVLEYFEGLTPEMVDAAFDYAAANPDTPEGMFYFSVDICPLLAALGWV
ncbi:MAG TPA: DUF433 domain-containing protein [Pyrinomonadaceae bacterium]|nr:DUF433 domain-containing protein [Pyrinomonadaceae bacterium]